MLKLTLTLILLTLLLAAPAAAQETPTVSPELLTFIEALETYTENTRELEPLEPLERLFPSRRDAISYVLGLYEEEITPEQAERYTHFYHAFDLLPPDTDYLDIYLELLSAQIGGFYEPETRQMNTILIGGGELGDDLPLLEQIIYVHEYTHALQDQHFGLEQVQERAGENLDLGLAIVSLIEGDAMLLTNTYIQSVAERDPIGTSMRLLTQGALTGTLVIPPGIPAIIAAEMLTPYERGMDFAVALYRAGGWEAVNAAFDNPPQTMEHILHPEKYLAGETAVPVALIDPEPGDAWELLWDNTLGEFYLREYLKTQLPALSANAAAAGWGGDNFHVYRHTDTGELAWVLRVVWDSEADAEEFTDVYLAFLDRRFGEDAQTDESCWTGTEAERTLCMVPFEGGHVLSSAPDFLTAQALSASQHPQS